ncbi:MAG: Tol-Pal system translocation protein TolB [Pseudomonadota bacterium]|jgi:TolB protein
MFKILLSIVLLVCNLLAADAYIDIEKSAVSLPKIAVEAYNNETVTPFERAQLDTMVLNDIRVSDHFENGEITWAKPGFASPVDFDSLIAQNYALLFRYRVFKQDNMVVMEVNLYDVTKKSLAFNKKFAVSEFDKYPFLSHKAAIAVNNYLGAPSIDWMDKFVVFAKFIANKQSNILIGDYTLTYQKTLVSGGYNTFPKWAGADQKAFYYTAYTPLPTLYKYDIYTGQKTKLITAQGMLVCSDVSKDGSKLLVTMPGSSGLPDIWLYNVNNGEKRNLTNFPGIDVNGKFIDGESRVAFVSDRLGAPTVFAQRVNDGGGLQQLLFSRNNTAFATNNNKIVYASADGPQGMAGTGVNVYMTDSTKPTPMRLTVSGSNDYPHLSEAGDAILFTRKDNGKSYVGIIRLNTNSTFLFPANLGAIRSLDW